MPHIRIRWDETEQRLNSIFYGLLDAMDSIDQGTITLPEVAAEIESSLDYLVEAIQNDFAKNLQARGILDAP